MIICLHLILIKLLSYRSFFQLVGDLSELREKDYADLKKTRIQQQLKLQEKKISKGFKLLTSLYLFRILTRVSVLLAKFKDCDGTNIAYSVVP